MLNRIYLLYSFTSLLLSGFSFRAFTQTLADSVHLKEAVIRVYPVKRPYLSTPASISVLNSDRLEEHPDQSLVPALNTLPGVRMEERSPGSYRLSIRGSLLRSPFGIRNVKIYLDEFPLTDAGGNTYLNLLDAGQVRNIEVLKGAEGSLFGANTGGVVLLNTLSPGDTSTVNAGLSAGTYGLLHQKAALKKSWKRYSLHVAQGYQRAEGYRENSALQRHYLQTSQQWHYRSSNAFKLLLLFSDLHYQTPGGLTLQQFQTSPRSARPRTGAVPGALEQKAGIYNSTIFGGLMHEAFLGKTLRHVIAVFGSKTDFKNPFITNFEIRRENSNGIRTYLEWKARETAAVNWTWNFGWEAQQTGSDISNHINNAGVKGILQASDLIAAREHFFFTQVSLYPGSRWIIETAFSMNNYRYRYKNRFPLAETEHRMKTFEPQFLPRLALAYKLMPTLVWRASLSKGYSPPTLAEVRPSDNMVHINLQPETSINYETGLRMLFAGGRLRADAVFFYCELKNAIVRRTNSNNAEYFVNAGGTRQPGMEMELSARIIEPRPELFLRGLELRHSMTYYDFSFTSYEMTGSDYSGNPLTGVPDISLVTGCRMEFPYALSLFVQHNYTGRISLNDAASVYAPDYHLMQLRTTWKYLYGKKWGLELFAGIDNLLNESYSLGNDLNAFGGRYYNAAPLRNYYGGCSFSF